MRRESVSKDLKHLNDSDEQDLFQVRTSVEEELDIETYALPLATIVKRLDSDLEHGLSRSQAEKRVRELGLNTIPKIACASNYVS